MEMKINVEDNRLERASAEVGNESSELGDDT